MDLMESLIASKLLGSGGGGGGSTLISKTITSNGEYNASDDEADGYSDVTVNVQDVPFSLQTEKLVYGYQDGWDDTKSTSNVDPDTGNYLPVGLTLTSYTNFNEYLEYTLPDIKSYAGYFTVKKDFVGIITAWVLNYGGSSGSSAWGASGTVLIERNNNILQVPKEIYNNYIAITNNHYMDLINLTTSKATVGAGLTELQITSSNNCIYNTKSALSLTSVAGIKNFIYNFKQNDIIRVCHGGYLSNNYANAGYPTQRIKIYRILDDNFNKDNIKISDLNNPIWTTLGSYENEA